MKTVKIPLPDPYESWALVELYRWEHGQLPGIDGKPEQPLSVPGGLLAMASAIEKGDPSNFPTPHNVCCVLRFVAARLQAASAPNAELRHGGGGKV